MAQSPLIKDLYLWDAFTQVAKTKSFTEAALQLRLSTPQLSKRIAALEAQLKTALFQRTTRRVSLTAEGQRILPEIEGLLHALSAMEGKSRAARPEGHLRITAITALGIRLLSRLIPRFLKSYPKITTELLLSDHLVDMVSKQIDIAIRASKPEGADFIYRPWISNDLVFVATPSYLKRMGRPETPKDLQEHSLFYLPAYQNLKFKNLPTKIQNLSRRPPILCENGLFLSQLALENAGIAIRSRWDIEKDLQEKKLVTVLDRFPLESHGWIYLVTPPLRFPNQMAQVFIDFLLQEIKTENK